MENTGAQFREQIEAIRHRMLRGELSYEQAQVEAKPVIDDMNAKGKALAKKFGKRYTPLTFKYLFR